MEISTYKTLNPLAYYLINNNIRYSNRKKVERNLVETDFSENESLNQNVIFTILYKSTVCDMNLSFSYNCFEI